MDDYKNNISGNNNQNNDFDVINSAESTDKSQNTASQQPTMPQKNDTGFYSYKYPNTANDPEYAAKTQTSNSAYSAENAFGSNASADSTHTADFSGSGTYSTQQNSADANNSFHANGYAQNQNYTQTPPTGGYAPYNQYNAAAYTKPPKPKKDKRKYPMSALIACCLICAVIASGVTSVGVIYANKYLDGSNSSSGSGNTVINVDKSTSNAISAVAEKVVPSVVGIRVTASVSSFFGMSQDSSSEGSGVIYKSNGYIITNYHVISSAVETSNQSAAAISVYLPEDTSTAIKAEVVGYNSESDLAVIKINKTGLNAAEFADSDKLEVGEVAVAVGNPGGLDFISSVSSGIISGLNRTLKLEGTTEMKLIQTDAAINPGNSGGALSNSEGKIVGINSSKISSTDYEGMGFAIPANYVKSICDDIINNKNVKKAYLGVKISTDYDADTLKSMGYPAGAVVESVADSSPASKVGIRQADIITSFAGVDISDYSGYNKERLNHKPGETVKLTIYRSGQYYNVSLTLGESTN